MAEHYLDFGPADRREVLEFAASESGRPACLLEKDVLSFMLDEMQILVWAPPLH